MYAPSQSHRVACVHRSNSKQQAAAHLATSQPETGEHVLCKQAYKDRLLSLLPLLLLYIVNLYKYLDALFVVAAAACLGQ